MIRALQNSSVLFPDVSADNCCVIGEELGQPVS